jgi:hypothetical protein
MNLCIFCGWTEARLSEEHIWPHWASRLLRDPGFAVDYFRHLESTGDSTNANWIGRYLDVTVDTVCEPCNNEWLGRFENDDVKPLGESMIVGDAAFSLLPSGQSVLATWAYKMALLLDARMPHAEHGHFFTSTDRLQFRHRTVAHPYVRVFLTKYNYGHHPAHAMIPRHTLTERDGERRAFNLLISTVTTGQLALQVMSVRSEATGQLVPANQLAFNFEGLARYAVLSIWPVERHVVCWPPEYAIDALELEDWTAMWAKAIGPEMDASK